MGVKPSRKLIAIETQETIGNKIRFAFMMDIMAPLPHALDENFPLFAQIAEKKPALFLDFDGTLTQLVAHPSQAVLSHEVRETLRNLAKKITVAVISGRNRKEVEDLVQIPELYYGGAHGFDLKGPNLEKIPEEVLPLLPELQEAGRYFEGEMKNFPGTWMEDKKYGVTLHYRPMDPALIPRLKESVEQFAKLHPRLKMTSGKQILELRPRLEWDKGFAVFFLLKTLHLDGPEILPIFLGDDETDEDAFRALKNHGWGILVEPSPGKTAARAFLKSADEVETFLERLWRALS